MSAMTRHDSWPAGVPCWTDLMVPDPAAVKPFYEAVLGWTFTEPDDTYGGYVMGMRDGAPVAGMGPLLPGSRAGWTMYFASDDMDATAVAIRSAGGTVVRDPDSVGPLGRMLIASDPTGAVFGIWQAGTFAGSAIANEAGALVWEDLRSQDPDAARAFYGSVFGFGFAGVDMASADYTTFALSGETEPRGGIGGMMDAEGVGSHWLVYFGVAEMDAALAAAAATGGSAPIPPFDTPYGRMAGLTDPAGVSLWIIELAVGDAPG